MADLAETQTDPDTVTREITIDAPLDEVWETVSTDSGRERWLEPDEDRRLVVEDTQPPARITWWWWNESDNEPARYVDVRVAPAPDGAGTRVTVTETKPSLIPVAQLAASFELCGAAAA
jgi:hypothetical protein